MIASINAKETHNSNKEAFKFKNSVLTTPQEYIDPSNKIAKAKVSEIEGSYTKEIKEVCKYIPALAYDPV